MIRKKTQEEIQRLAAAGHVLGGILDVLVATAAVGVTGNQLNTIAEKMIADAGAQPVFKGYGEPPFPASICISINQQVVHGIPNNVPFQEGDIVSIDAGLSLGGMIVDSARTVGVGAITDEYVRLLAVTKQALVVGIAQALPGSPVGNIGHAIQEYVEGEGFEVVRKLVGHGVGFELHEEPQVPNFGLAGLGPVLQEGMVIAIEPMVTIGSPDVDTADDGWGIVAISGKSAAHEEHTIAITKSGPVILTA
ncbi:MAG: type I methionyl aminopeptidase [Candidatus Andersenbacteria bacterium RIFCSPHIGHO2_02_FULL_45_11]|uniref:Methionine aminopeptidase n=1 Tax=Candidatus Andersenbacteria bacterium RIFCSPHIGHO2_12_FULL_45_11 TaxID=1797281 RepID=A0A1G1X2X3_9BACT|nr:MAG: type I methionyl aminopeptidase [Candidatus Andersenbacteria bacterium RIFCSPHIGHO2_01_FULL_46_36]OGY34369.1 MAG: type I methionyl aminopeptidase [Candidatus Andersenbacteria bacterium RIFCSPHIGHO2_12_FULL_45_11]OGY34948.1 MAG: type I methionyl aminopeptidase [Candidatus Andersenbacteria bacterium RIFCSPHIGHO2_02_FULL_45_11]